MSLISIERYIKWEWTNYRFDSVPTLETVQEIDSSVLSIKAYWFPNVHTKAPVYFAYGKASWAKSISPANKSLEDKYLEAVACANDPNYLTLHNDLRPSWVFKTEGGVPLPHGGGISQSLASWMDQTNPSILAEKPWLL